MKKKKTLIFTKKKTAPQALPANRGRSKYV